MTQPRWNRLDTVLVIVLLLFGRGKIPELMGDVAKGITSFKKGLNEPASDVAETIDHNKDETVSPAKKKSEARSKSLPRFPLSLPRWKKAWPV